MRKYFLLFTSLTILIVCSAQSQIKKGAHFLGGSINFSTEINEINSQDYKSSAVLFSPAYGRAIKENLILGADITVANNENETINFNYNYNSFGGGFFVRKYKPLGKGFYLFGQGRFGGAFTKEEYDHPVAPDDRETTAFIATASFFPGISYAINDKLHLETGLNDLLFIQYSYEETDYESTFPDSKKNRFSVGSNLSGLNWLTIGVRFIFN